RHHRRRVPADLGVRPGRAPRPVGGAAGSGGGHRGDQRLARSRPAPAGPGPRAGTAGGRWPPPRAPRLPPSPPPSPPCPCSPPRPSGRTSVRTGPAKPRAGEPPAARQKRVWDKAAPSYDKQIAFFEKIWFGGGREWLGERAHSRVLEVAIGTGLNLPHSPADAVVTGVELSPAMLAIARQRAADLGPAIDLREGGAAHPPFAAGRVDTV